jgi:uncharacterized membrane protein
MNRKRNDQPHLRFHLPYSHLSSVFGSDRFGVVAERFARFFGTPTFIIAQSLIVGIWIVSNAMENSHFDPYPFILLNLAFSLQAAYAAPLILLAQTRMADRDKVMSEADALHREELATSAEVRQRQIADQTSQLFELVEQNTDLTELIQKMSERIEKLTSEVHKKLSAEAQ